MSVVGEAWVRGPEEAAAFGEWLVCLGMACGTWCCGEGRGRGAYLDVQACGESAFAGAG
jgi:hypothetical protein